MGRHYDSVFVVLCFVVVARFDNATTVMALVTTEMLVSATCA